VIATKDDEDEEEKESEEEIYLNGRFLCAMDAMSRALGFHTYPKQEPSTVSVAIKTKKQCGYYSAENKLTDMSVYMMTREIPELENLSIREFFRLYYYTTKEPNFEKTVEKVDYFIVPHGTRRVVYLKQYVRNDLRVVRLEMLYPDAGEPYYLRGPSIGEDGTIRYLFPLMESLIPQFMAHIKRRQERLDILEVTYHISIILLIFRNLYFDGRYLGYVFVNKLITLLGSYRDTVYFVCIIY
jgi:hypothetical protein